MVAALRAKLLPRAKRSPPSRRLYSKLDDYQARGVDFAMEVKTAALLFEQGVGKTWVAGGVIEQLMTRDFVGLCVVLLTNLESTWLTFLRREFPQLNICRNLATFKAAPSPKLLLVNYEAVPPITSKLRRIKFTFMCYDEAQRLKNRTALASRRAAQLASSAEYKLILTGTPMDDSPADLWAQFRFLNVNVFGKRWKDFEDEYFDPLPVELEQRFKSAKPGSFKFKTLMRQMRIANGKREFNWDKFDQFAELIKPWAMRVTKEVLNLPPLHIRPIAVRLRGEQRRLYEELSRSMIATLPRGRIASTPLRVTQLGRLQQICGGFLPDDLGDMHEVGRAKMRVINRLVEEQRKPIVIFCRYISEVKEVAAELTLKGYRVAILMGKTKKQDRAPMIAAFQRGEIDVLVSQVKTGGVGVDLFKASVAIFYSYTYSFIDYEQALSRLHRRGQENVVSLFLLFAVDTVDEAIIEAILAKRKITRRVLTTLEARRNNHGRREDREVWRQSPRRQAGRRPGNGSRRAA